MKKIIILIISFLFLFGSTSVNCVSAVTKTSGDLEVTYDDPLFPSTISWYPGFALTKSISIKNKGSITHTVSIKADTIKETANIAQLYLFKITEGANDRYGGTLDKTLKDFWKDGETNLSDVAPGKLNQYDITITMPANADNKYQDKTAQFDLMIGFSGEKSKIPIRGTGPNVLGAAASESKPLLLLVLAGSTICIFGFHYGVKIISKLRK